jgi:hypothetical protein
MRLGLNLQLLNDKVQLINLITRHQASTTHLYSQQKPSILVLHLFLTLLVLFQALYLLFQTPNILDGRLQDGALVRSDVSDYLIIRIVGFWQQCAQLFDAIINVEAAAALDCKRVDII